MIVVTSPTGNIGKQLTQELLVRGNELRLIARDPSRLDPNVRRNVEVFQGSHGDRAVLNRALAGADALFWLVPPNPASPSAAEHYLAFANAAKDQIARHEVSHVVAVSSAGHGWPKPAGVLSSAFAMDSVLRQASTAYRALSMGFYMENLLGQIDAIANRGLFSLTGPADVPLPVIATDDIAQLAAELLSDLNWTGQEDIPVIGPDHLTPDQMAAVMAEELRRPVEYHRVSTEDYAARLRSVGVPERQVEEAIETAIAVEEGIYNADWARATPTRTDFRTWTRRALAPAASRVTKVADEAP
jgi:uncharacterized protein YbjT (DUF2867 family)